MDENITQNLRKTLIHLVIIQSFVAGFTFSYIFFVELSVNVDSKDFNLGVWGVLTLFYVTVSLIVAKSIFKDHQPSIPGNEKED